MLKRRVLFLYFWKCNISSGPIWNRKKMCCEQQIWEVYPKWECCNVTESSLRSIAVTAHIKNILFMFSQVALFRFYLFFFFVWRSYFLRNACSFSTGVYLRTKESTFENCPFPIRTAVTDWLALNSSSSFAWHHLHITWNDIFAQWWIMREGFHGKSIQISCMTTNFSCIGRTDVREGTPPSSNTSYRIVICLLHWIQLNAA